MKTPFATTQTNMMRRAGIDVVGDIPWGTHFCLFYDTKADLLETLVCYCKAGLQSQEFCLWVVAPPVTREDALEALRQAVPSFDSYLPEGGIEIVPARDWYLPDGTFDLNRVIAGWNETLRRASARGYVGVRVTGDTAWLERKHWKDFCEYEDALNESITNQRLAVLCTYPLASCGAQEILDVVRTHEFAVTKRRGSWDVIETAGYKKAKTEIKRLNEELEQRVKERTEALQKAIEEIRALKDQLYKENLALRDEIDRASMFEEIVGASPALQAVLAWVAKVGPTDSTVLITGETGTGKELIARAIHKRSKRSGRAFVSVNCAALAASLISSELFGHEKGAFTGATHRRLGRFELADGGTIFLDEVGELPPETQVALLRVLQEREFERVGGTQPVRVDVRIIAATNRDLKAATASGAFRQDLFYRLNVFPIDVPPLRERGDDILVLVEHLVQRYARIAGKNIRSIGKNTLELFESYDWPGNIRELQNVIERSVILTSGDILRVDESWLSKKSSQHSNSVEVSNGCGSDRDEERKIIEAALRGSRGRVSGPLGAAAKLKVPPTTLENKIKALNIRKSLFKFA
ncbi:MAG TPA: sigma 54-interacting transcriptional regulator [Candidatus Acidoferrales bacterium]|nr:sigma 54-interacting transcriptional regulator [Candidatus Acidoferrales bacterium]